MASLPSYATFASSLSDETFWPSQIALLNAAGSVLGEASELSEYSISASPCVVSMILKDWMVTSSKLSSWAKALRVSSPTKRARVASSVTASMATLALLILPTTVDTDSIGSPFCRVVTLCIAIPQKEGGARVFSGSVSRRLDRGVAS